MQENNQRRNPFLWAPALALPAILLFGIAGFVFSKPLEGNAAYIVAALLPFFVFGVPTALFFYMRGGGWFSSRLSSVSPRGVLLSAAAALIMMIHSAFFHSLTLSDFFEYHVYTLYGIPFWLDIDSFGAFFSAFLLLALLPALLEGIFFRGVLMHEYRYGGVILSVLIPSVLCALTGTDLTSFLLYFLNAIVLSMTAFLTGNIFCSVFAHFIYLMFAILGEKYVLFLAVEMETRIILLFFLIWLWLTIAIFFFDTAENVLRRRGEKEHKRPIALAKKNRLIVIFDIVSVPALWADIFCFAVFGILHLFI